MVLRTTTNLLDQETLTVFRCRKNFVREIFAVTDNREKFLTAKISRYTVVLGYSEKVCENPDHKVSYTD